MTKKSGATSPNSSAKPPRPAKIAKAPARPGAASHVGAVVRNLEAGMPAPDFGLPREDGTMVSLSGFAGRKLVIFFYPRADTPGCTREAIDFTRLAADFAACDTALLGVSADTPKKQQTFRAKHALAMPLASDLTQEMLQRYGVWGQKTMYGKVFEGIFRTTLLVDGSGRIARIWRNVKVEGHADEVLAAARALAT